MPKSKSLAPKLPSGNSSTWQGVTENFTFHASPELFIATRISGWQRQNPETAARSVIVSAKILNRNVAIVSSYKHVKAILGQDDSSDVYNCIASAAYNGFMGQFFPAPNLLLADGYSHATMKQSWVERMGIVKTQCCMHTLEVIDAFLVETTLNNQLDLYECMKTLSWQVLLGCFLDVQSEDHLFAEIKSLQEALLRGQFSLMPVNINVGFWRSARKRGIDARKALQALIMKRLLDSGNKAQSMFETHTQEELTQTVNHILMMTSSLASKALASLLTAYLLNIFLFDTGGHHLYQEVNQLRNAEEQRMLLQSIYLETERLSPPIVGVMRRLTDDIIIEDDHDVRDTLLPSGWDCWLYIVGASRDEAVFSHSSERFDPKRYLDNTVSLPLGFGFGPKTCLGQDLIREICLLVAQRMLSKRLSIQGKIVKAGLKGWLGWATASPEDWAAHMKQLPTQHPTDAVPVLFVHN